MHTIAQNFKTHDTFEGTFRENQILAKIHVVKPRQNALEFSFDSTRHLSRVKCREHLAILYSDVKWCRAMSSVVGSNLIKVIIVERKVLKISIA